ncbi:MAG: DUF4921 family protein [Firmicutes bacterium]|nr:DUF4921 family protein [Bacillota bacterium]
MPELRQDIITGDWTVIATERARRPQNFTSKNFEAIQSKPSFKPDCPFCPGNERETPPEVFAYRDASAPADSGGWKVRVVPNKFPAFSQGKYSESRSGIYSIKSATGVHDVIIETPRHDISPGLMAAAEFHMVLKAYRQRYRMIMEDDPRLEYILIFRNHGRPAGASLEHPHSQISALGLIPPVIAKELQGTQLYYEANGKCVYCDMIHEEVETGSRLLAVQDGYVAFQPFASRVPFETWVIPINHQSRFELEDDPSLEGLSRVMTEALKALSISLGDPAYNYVLHTSPCHGDHFFHWHIEILPKLTIQAGFEIGTGMYINVARPEETAEFLRNSL